VRGVSLQAARHVDRAHIMPHRLQCRLHLLERRAFLDLGRTVAAAEVRQVDGLLHVEVPVERGHQHLGDIVDDEAAAGLPAAISQVPARSNTRKGAMELAGACPAPRCWR
jgi:hypothetical protein